MVSNKFTYVFIILISTCTYQLIKWSAVLPNDVTILPKIWYQ